MSYRKINDASEIEDEDLRKWFEDYEERVKNSDHLQSLKGEYDLFSLKYLKTKEEKRSESYKQEKIGCLTVIGILISGIIGSLIHNHNNSENKFQTNTYTPLYYNQAGSGKCNYPSQWAKDGSRCGKRAASEK